MSKHTPGPWTITCVTRDDKAGFSYQIDQMESEYEIANSFEGDSLMEAANERNEANAALIARSKQNWGKAATLPEALPPPPEATTPAKRTRKKKAASPDDDGEQLFKIKVT